MSAPHMAAASSRPNHPLAVRMAVIAFLCWNLTMGSMWGSFGVLVAPVEAKMHVTRAVSALGVPLVSVVAASLGPVIGTLVTRVSLRLLLVIASVMQVGGYLLLAAADRMSLNLLAYGLLIGPGVCMGGQVLPATLVTRWFDAGRGRALGIVHMPIMVALVPLIMAFVLKGYGLSGAYLTLAGLMVLSTIAVLFIVDYPPSALDPSGEDVAAETAADPGLTIPMLLRRPVFWALAIGFTAILGGSTILGAHMVPMMLGRGIEATRAAGLLTITSLAGIAGTLVFGWIADKLSGRVAMAILCVDNIALFLLLMLDLPYPALALVVGLIGFHGAPVVPAFSMALSEAFGAASFSRAFGLGSIVSMPFMLVGVPLVGAVYVRSGSYAPSLVGIAVFFAIAALGILAAGRARRAAPAFAA